MEKEPYVFCPMTKLCCTKECAWYCDGKCALVVLTERMFDVAMGTNNIRWAIKDNPARY